MTKDRLKALNIQATINRKHAIDQVFHASSGHPGGSLSAMDILTSLYFNEMKVDPKKPLWEDRDRFVLSKARQRCMRAWRREAFLTKIFCQRFVGRKAFLKVTQT